MSAEKKKAFLNHWVAEGVAKNVASRVLAVAPERERRSQVLNSNNAGTVEHGVQTG